MGVSVVQAPPFADGRATNVSVIEPLIDGRDGPNMNLNNS